jgi:hypothetical protein
MKVVEVPHLRSHAIVPHCMLDLLCTSICTHLLQIKCSAEYNGSRS